MVTGTMIPLQQHLEPRVDAHEHFLQSLEPRDLNVATRVLSPGTHDPGRAHPERAIAGP
jgi:hypothetical protein